MHTVYDRDALLAVTHPNDLRQTILQALETTPITDVIRLKPSSLRSDYARRSVNRVTMVFNGTRNITMPFRGRMETKCLAAGSAIVVPRRSWSRPVGKQRSHRYLSIDCYPTFTRFMCEYTDGPRSGHGAFYTSHAANACARHLLEALTLLPENTQPAKAASIFSAFVSEILRDCKAHREDDSGRQHWQAAACWIQDNLSPDIGRDHIAAAIGIHPNHLSRICQQQTSERLTDYITRLRIERAQELLTDTDLAIRDIVVESGYRDETHFRKRFKQITGFTPGSFRQRAQYETAQAP